MALHSVESGKISQHVVNIFFLLWSHLLYSWLFFGVEQIATDHKLFSSYSFREFMIVYFYKLKLHLLFFFSIIFIELHLCKEEFSIVIILHLKISTSRHVTNNLGRIGASPRSGVSLIVEGEMASLVLGVSDLLSSFSFEYFVAWLFVQSVGFFVSAT